MVVYFLCFVVYPDGKVCISILHPPGDDPNGYELASERWTPVHTVGYCLFYQHIFCVGGFMPVTLTYHDVLECQKSSTSMI